MSDDNEHASIISAEDHVISSSISRWVPMVVVSSALAGFVGLAWYAYQAGTQSLNDDALLVVEADTTPMKEKPEDPGGMQFPNQDKIIFETFAGDNKEPPKVERILPAPEEPIPSAGETTTWVNEKLHDTAKNEAETNVTPKEDTNPKVEIKEEFVREVAVDKQQNAEAPTNDTIKSFKQEKAAETKEPAAVLDSAVKTAALTGPVKAQLGAYGSEKEAKSAWSNMAKKHGTILSDRDYIVVKADLGAKGIFYRLRVLGFVDTNAAKSFCSKLTAKGQACIPVAQ